MPASTGRAKGAKESAQGGPSLGECCPGIQATISPIQDRALNGRGRERCGNVEVLSAQMRQPVQVVATDPVSAADKVFNARYYPLVDCPRFRFPTLQQRVELAYTNWLRYMGPLPYLDPLPEDLPTGDPSPKTPLYPRTPAITPAADAQGAVDGR